MMWCPSQVRVSESTQIPLLRPSEHTCTPPPTPIDAYSHPVYIYCVSPMKSSILLIISNTASFAATPTNLLLGVANEAGLLAVVDVRKRDEQRVQSHFQAHSNAVFCLKWLHNDRLIATGTAKTITPIIASLITSSLLLYIETTPLATCLLLSPGAITLSLSLLFSCNLFSPRIASSLLL